MKVRELASARCGDEENTSNAAVVAYDDAAYDVLDEYLTAERLAAELDDLVEDPVGRYDLPQLNAFNFVVENSLAGGVTKSLRMDGHGKSLSFAVLGIELDVGDQTSSARR